jgi:hypothetical protein
MDQAEPSSHVSDDPPAKAPVASVSEEEEGPSQYKSRRLNALDKAGKIGSFDETRTQPKRGKNKGKGRQDPKTPGRLLFHLLSIDLKRRSGLVGVTRTRHRILDFMPFQEVEKGVFIQQVRVKTFKVRGTILTVCSTESIP